MARLIITTETHPQVILLDEQVRPTDLSSLRLSERLLERLEWCVAEAFHADRPQEVPC